MKTPFLQTSSKNSTVNIIFNLLTRRFSFEGTKHFAEYPVNIKNLQNIPGFYPGAGVHSLTGGPWGKSTGKYTVAKRATAPPFTALPSIFLPFYCLAERNVDAFVTLNPHSLYLMFLFIGNYFLYAVCSACTLTVIPYK
jgi:hypothetical protein